MILLIISIKHPDISFLREKGKELVHLTKRANLPIAIGSIGKIIKFQEQESMKDQAISEFMEMSIIISP